MKASIFGDHCPPWYKCLGCWEQIVIIAAVVVVTIGKLAGH